MQDQIIKQQSMQELYLLIKERFDKLDLLTQGKLTSQQHRDLRQQQRARCQKQSWILSMFRAKKNTLTTAAKTNYYKYCYEIMRIIDSQFMFQLQPNLSDQSFLNDFVCLFTKFFDSYENKFQFKIKIKNLLRPTNHNIVNDLVKYLADFSRDYSQHVYIWQLKSIRKQQQQEQAEENQRKMAINMNMNIGTPSVIYSSNSSSTQAQALSDKQPLQSFRNSVNIGEAGSRRYSQDNEAEVTLKKNQFTKMYGIMQVQPLTNFMYTDKGKFNVDVLRLRMNQLYRDMKYRNNLIKSQVSLYYNTYHSKFNIGLTNAHTNKQILIQDSHPHVSHPYRVHLVIQRNGFSCINVTTNDQQRVITRDDRNLSPLKDKLRISSLSNCNAREYAVSAASKPTKNQFMLNSLKVLRVSQNFLPPLLNSGLKKDIDRLNSEQQHSSRKQSQMLNKKLSYSNTQNLIGEKKQQNISQNGVIYYNQQLLREAQRRKLQKRRLSQMRKHFTSEDKNKVKKSDPQQKIVQWLDKINMMKQLERKKIMGLG